MAWNDQQPHRTPPMARGTLGLPRAGRKTTNSPHMTGRIDLPGDRTRWLNAYFSGQKDANPQMIAAAIAQIEQIMTQAQIYISVSIGEHRPQPQRQGGGAYSQQPPPSWGPPQQAPTWGGQPQPAQVWGGQPQQQPPQPPPTWGGQPQQPQQPQQSQQQGQWGPPVTNPPF